MRQLTVAVLAMTMILTGVAWAQQDEHQQHHPEQQGDQAPGMMQGGGMMMDTGNPMMMGMMNAPDVAAWNGNVFMVGGMKLEKLNSNLEVVETVEFEHPAGMMEDGMMGGRGMQDGQQRPMMQRQGQQGGMMGGGMTQQGGGMTGEGMMQRMHSTHRARAKSNAAITADAQGVYVLRGFEMTVYDHDLNEIRRSEVMDMPEDAAMCPMCRQMMQRMQQDGGVMGGQGMQRGGMMRQQWGQPMERSLTDGMVHMYQRPPEARVGQMMFRVDVLDANQQMNEAASVRGFIYPKGQPEDGWTVNFGTGPGGHTAGSAQIPCAGQYELGVRVMRPDHEDTVIYYDISVGQ